MQSPPRLSFLGHPRFWVAAVSLVAVVSMGIVSLERTAPGPLSAVHAKAFEAEDVALNECSACHGGWFESMAGACYDCHDEIEGDLDEGQGMHGTMPDGIVLESCGSCHGEHNGPGFQLAGPRSFKVAGAGSREEFDHERVGFEFAGAHLELDCSECHVNADAEVLEPDQMRFRGLDQRCASCHEDDHAPVFPEDCTTCHDQEDWSEQRWDKHASFFERAGAHAQEDCTTCHLPSATPDETGRSFGRVAELLALRGVDLEARAGGHGRVRNQDCRLCHEDVHAGSFELADGAQPSCADCHSLVSFRSGLDDFDHGAATGFSLGGGHAELDCTACHVDDPSAARGRALATGANCASCHEEPHGGQFEAAPRGADCARCHAPEAPFLEPFFDHNTDSAFALEGRHVELDCAACHGLEEIAGAERRRYWPLDGDCAACHGVAEGGRLRRKSGSEKGGVSGL